MIKNILIIVGHPAKKNFSKSLANAYEKGAKKRKVSIKKIDLSEMKFNPILQEGYKKRQDLEKDLIDAQEKIKWSDHIVIIYPTWWGGFPAVLKGFFDRVFLPGFAYKYTKKTLYFPEGFLKRKRARIITTTGGSKLIYKILGFPYKRESRWMLFKFCGIKTRYTLFGGIRELSEKRTKKILKKVERLGKRLS